MSDTGKRKNISRMTVGVGVRGGRIEQKRKRTHGHGQQCGDCWGKGITRGLKCNIVLITTVVFVTFLSKHVFCC